MHRLAGLLLLTCLTAPCRADVYHWVDEKGVPVFSDSATDPRARLLWREARERAARSGARGGIAADLDPKDVPAELVAIATEKARTHALEPALLLAVMKVESNFNARAVSPKGARGLMQLMPDTARRYGVRNSHDPAQNIDGGARYLSDLLKMFDNDLSLALAAYNAGENAVIRNSNRIPPYRETMLYVPKVMRHLKTLRRVYS